MKTDFKFLTLSLFAACSLFGLSAAYGDDESEVGGAIDGTEQFHAEVVMTPTADAPPGSSITVSLDAEDNDGTTESKLSLETTLPEGTYFVTVTLRSDGSTVELGSFETGGDGVNQVDFGTSIEDGAAFPAGFNPFDVATVTVTDANGVILFTADLTSISTVTSLNFSANIVAKAGLGTPGAAGNVVLNAFVSRGIAKGSLQISGRGLPPSTALVVAINGTNVKNAKSDKAGNVNIRLAPKGKSGTVGKGMRLFGVTSVSLRDKSGNALLSASL